MYLEFDDRRPDTPRLPSALTLLERILLLAVVYLLIIIVYLVTPDSFWEVAPVQQVQDVSQSNLRFVQIQPLVDRPVLPKKPADASDLDRRTTTPERAPQPENDAPRSRGNTPEKVEAAPPEPPPAPDPGASTSAPSLTSKVMSQAPAVDARPPVGILGNALRNPQHYLPDPNTFDNPQGGATDYGPDIQFDSKGVDFGAWLRRFRAQVYHNWLIPQAAMVMHGHVVIQLNIHRDGAITDLRIAQPSGIQAFDIAAVNAMKQSNPTVPLPSGYPLDIAAFTVTFYYNERIR